jgi:TIR domain-containing protein
MRLKPDAPRNGGAPLNAGVTCYVSGTDLRLDRLIDDRECRSIRCASSRDRLSGHLCCRTGGTVATGRRVELVFGRHTNDRPLVCLLIPSGSSNGLALRRTLLRPAWDMACARMRVGIGCDVCAENAITVTTTAFVSYSWDDDEHKAWARGLAERLRADGVVATLDQWAAVPGDQLPELMERAIADNKHVLIVCTPRYKSRSERREGGVGYEGDIITAEVLQTRNHRKFIPILRRGDWREAAPSWLAGKYYIDLRDGARYEAQYQDLLSTLLGSRPAPPPVAVITSQPKVQATPVNQPRPESEPVRIVGVIADQVGEPRNDGTRGSALYAVPFRLSRRVSHDWAQVFEQVWNRPPQFTSMHRPGIARVSGDQIVLDGTTVEEVQRYHRDTLVLCVKETNRIITEHEHKIRMAEEEERRRSEEHQARVRDLSGKIKFDE